MLIETANCNIDYRSPQLYSFLDYFNTHTDVTLLQFTEKHKLTRGRGMVKAYELPIVDIDKVFPKLGTVYGSGAGNIVCEDPNCPYILSIRIIDSKKHSITVQFYVVYRDNFKEIERRIAQFFTPYLTSKKTINVDWATQRKGDIDFTNLTTVFNEKILQEAYPYIHSLENYVNRFLDSTENVLLLIGPPGTGKTRLIRYIIQNIGLRNQKPLENADEESSLSDKQPYVLYAMDDKVFSTDNFFIRFLTTAYDLVVLEDIDFNLKSRKDGNTFMYKLLGGSDGLITNMDKKVILSTNLPNVNDIDDALVRPGRCFDIIHTRQLTFDEANALCKKIKAPKMTVAKDSFSLADIYTHGTIRGH